MNYTEEQQQEFLERAGKFQEEYNELSKKWSVSFVPQIQTVPKGNGEFGLIATFMCGDLKYAIPSPISNEDLTDKG